MDVKQEISLIMRRVINLSKSSDTRSETYNLTEKRKQALNRRAFLKYMHISIGSI